MAAAASTYGIVLWAIPRFRRAESVIPKAFQPASGADKSLSLAPIAAPSTMKEPEPGACLRFAH